MNEQVGGAGAKFWPLWPWNNGTKEKPKGYVCLTLGLALLRCLAKWLRICANVYAVAFSFEHDSIGEYCQVIATDPTKNQELKLGCNICALDGICDLGFLAGSAQSRLMC